MTKREMLTRVRAILCELREVRSVPSRLMCEQMDELERELAELESETARQIDAYMARRCSARRREDLMRALALLVILAAPATLSAQSLAELSRTRPVAQTAAMHPGPIDKERARADREALTTASWVYVAAASGDWALTAACAAPVYCGEHTQTGLFFYGVERPALAIPVGLALDGVFVWSVRELVAPDHPKLARGILYVASGVRLVFAVNKVNEIRSKVTP